jgi:probable rRNA maturation factor
LNDPLVILNRQRAVRVNVRLLRRLTQVLLQDMLRKSRYAVGICLVDSLEMARLNETFLQHEGPTDVITFDYSRDASDSSPAAGRKGLPAGSLSGEIFICLAEAETQARRFRTSWPMELARYVVHGVLHLSGYDDLQLRDRRVMKREENRLLRELGRRLPLPDLERARSAATSRKVRATKKSGRIRRRFALSKRSRNPKMAS